MRANQTSLNPVRERLTQESFAHQSAQGISLADDQPGALAKVRGALVPKHAQICRLGESGAVSPGAKEQSRLPDPYRANA